MGEKSGFLSHLVQFMITIFAVIIHVEFCKMSVVG